MYKMPRRSRLRVRKVRRAARRGGRRSRVPRSLSLFNDKGQMARIKETVEFIDLSPNLGYNFNFNLSQFRRASTLAPSFKFYKATLVEWTIEPLYNTFQDGTTGGEVTVPYIYMTMNRTQDSTGIGLSDIQAMGAKPKKLTSKMVIKYKPNWCSPGLTQYKVNPYPGLQLPVVDIRSQGLQAQYTKLACPDTNPGQNLESNITPAYPGGLNPANTGMAPVITNQVVYNGHTVWIDQEIPTGTLQSVARVTCTVHWSFSDPHCTYLDDAYVNVVPANSIQL